MAHMQALAGGIGKLHQRVELGLAVVVGGAEGADLLPLFLPFFLDAVKLVFHCFSSSFTVRLEISMRVPSLQSRSSAYISRASFWKILTTTLL